MLSGCEAKPEKHHRGPSWQSQMKMKSSRSARRICDLPWSWGCLVSVWILLGVSNDSPPFRYLLIPMGLACPVMIVTSYLETGRGTFRLDKEGIQQVSWLSKSRYLGWQEVDQVKWFPHTYCLQGKGTSISISWTMISRWSAAAPAKAFVE